MSLTRLLCLTTLSLALAAGSALAERRVSEEADLFHRHGAGVFTIFSEDGKGSGFLVDDGGLVVTNNHVVGDGDHLHVQLNDSLKVVGQLLATDSDRDLAVLRINPACCAELPVLPLSPGGEGYAFVGERVLAIGSPLNQDRIMTIGIISKVEDEAIISDVNINHGNSGGPLLNLDGEVIAINTFGDFAATGPGVSGSISIELLTDVLAEARRKAERLDPPPADPTPIMPRESMPQAALHGASTALKWPVADYTFRAGDFHIFLHTPASIYWSSNRQQIQRSARLQGSGDSGGGDDPLDDVKSWMQYTGGLRPVVVLQVMPHIGETTGSVIGAIFTSALVGAASHKLEFKADLADFKLHEGDRHIQECARGEALVPLEFNVSQGLTSVRGDDMAKAGVFFFTIEDFLPDEDGWPALQLTIHDAREDGAAQTFEFHQAALERVAADFDHFNLCKRLAAVPSLASAKQTP